MSFLTYYSIFYKRTSRSASGRSNSTPKSRSNSTPKSRSNFHEPPTIKIELPYKKVDCTSPQNAISKY
ncbi:hypothetical protein [Geminocystis herdmanii]|uniref:hypothetical protein n=1 Tax=Geminocystis herdmanii TaxID=669359 RepID=UPI00034C673C|nr:hypothetical protein [Geminocystis herdmanii]